MSRAFDDLLALMTRLRSRDGCPWDREQDLASVSRYVTEEASELADAIRRGDPASVREELGDLLYTAVFVAEIARENGWFTADDAARGVVEKLVRRHPHVFAGERAESVADVLRIWEREKAREKRAVASEAEPPPT
jgi:uncharacterized protein YabN with tetrapyrrole methylase and pyrophosphatase domain